MIHPSYTELIEAINRGSEEGEADMVLNSRYSLVLATSKRARQLIAGSKPLVKGANGKKPLSVAIEELYQGKVKILPPQEEEDSAAIEEHPIKSSYSIYNAALDTENDGEVQEEADEYDYGSDREDDGEDIYIEKGTDEEDE